MDSANILCDEKKDRISELPINVIDCIFMRMPIRDAAKTVILSKNWRYIWPSYPQLVFDKNFVIQINNKYQRIIQSRVQWVFSNKKRKRFIGGLFENEYRRVINHVLSVHSGPVLKFFLHIPKLTNQLSSEIDGWMSYLSTNGIKELELENLNSKPYIMPSCILLCSSLIELKLHNCMLKPPNDFGGFHYLKRLILIKVSFSASAYATLLNNALVLWKLEIKDCTGIKQRRIHAPKLEVVSMYDNDKVDLGLFKRSKRLRTLLLKLGKEVKNVDQTFNMIKFLKNIRNVQRLWLDGFSLKYLAAGDWSKSLATPMLPRESARFLKFVRLNDFRVHDLDQISCAICLLKRSPKLTTLEFQVAYSTDDVPIHITEYLESSNCIELSLHTLETVKIPCFKGLKAEILLIKYLLARSTNLQRMIIQQLPSNDASIGIKIYEELLQFTRASSRAKVYVVPI